MKPHEFRLTSNKQGMVATGLHIIGCDVNKQGCRVIVMLDLVLCWPCHRAEQGGDGGPCSGFLPVGVKLRLHCVPHREQ